MCQKKILFAAKLLRLYGFVFRRDERFVFVPLSLIYARDACLEACSNQQVFVSSKGGTLPFSFSRELEPRLYQRIDWKSLELALWNFATWILAVMYSGVFWCQTAESDFRRPNSTLPVPRNVPSFSRIRRVEIAAGRGASSDGARLARRAATPVACDIHTKSRAHKYCIFCKAHVRHADCDNRVRGVVRRGWTTDRRARYHRARQIAHFEYDSAGLPLFPFRSEISANGAC